MSDSLRSLGSFDELIAQRRDAVGSDGTTTPIEGFGRTWHIAVPSLQSAEWNDEFQDLVNDATEGAVSSVDYRDELCALVLGDQADDFKAAAHDAGVDPLMLLNWALREIAADERLNPTQASSRASRKRVKRR